MKTNPLVSILIPVYNRENLIGETLDSIQAQSYKNWEAIIVDDESTDQTIKVIKTYCEKDSRFKLFSRPSNKPQGGNAARNFALEQCQGEYVNWFDSDDLMEVEFLAEKIAPLLQDESLDFTVSKSSKFFEDGSEQSYAYYLNNDSLPLNLNNFIQEKVHWLTPDLLIKKDSLGGVKFNEHIKSGQEYNFILKLLAKKRVRGRFIGTVLCKVRKHDSSIQQHLTYNELLGYKRKFKVALLSFTEVYKHLNVDSKRFMVKRLLDLAHSTLRAKEWPKGYMQFIQLYCKVAGVKRSLLLLIHHLCLYLGKESYTLKKEISIKI